VTCQRCLRPMEIRIDETISLNLVQGLDEAERLSDGHDPLLVGNDGVKPLDLVEDELLLAIPHVPRHANEEDCDVEAWRSQQIPLQSQDQEVDVETENPFSELARLKEQLH